MSSHPPRPCHSSRVCVVVSVVVGGAGGAGDAGDEGVFRGWAVRRCGSTSRSDCIKKISKE